MTAVIMKTILTKFPANKGRQLSNFIFWGILSVTIAWVTYVLFLYPIWEIVKISFIKNGEFSLSSVERAFGSRRVIESISNTLRMSLYTVITVNIIGIFQVAVIDYFKVRGAWLLKLAFLTPLVYSSVALVTGYNFIYSSTGVITKISAFIFPFIDVNWFKGEYAVLFVHTFSMTTMHMLFMRAAIKKIDFSIIQAAQSLGMGPISTLVKVVLPVLKPTIFAVTLLVLLGAMSSFAAPVILGGRDFHMINSIILLMAQIGRTDIATLLSLILGITSLALLMLMRHSEQKGTYYSISKTRERLQKVTISNRVANITIHLTAYLLLVIYLAPVLLVVLFSFAPSANILTETIPSSFTLENYRNVLSGGQAFVPLWNSIKLGVYASIAAISFSVLCTYLMHKHNTWWSKVLEMVLYIPWFMPATMLAMGLIVSYDSPKLAMFNQVLVGSYWILPIAMAVSMIPFMVRMLGSAFMSMDPNLDDAAKSLGASTLYTIRRVTLPLLSPVIILVSALSFQGSLSDYNLAVMLYNVDNYPLGIALMQAASAMGPEQVATSMVYIVILMLICSVITGIANYYGLDKHNC
ncbi:iron ABC transporter permease [Vibrio sp. B1Z05]|uniref:ABC transporter permease n=1 Tax=Vibrio sp. B1Z05 TaxID=2654980 RepID=UPI00128B5DDB|nr:iron ABC transporter permease [Vibrio sp. B1Z05]MPW35819.1 ABC transporter permease subunit [Vibrio sp. B1Z05]